MFTITRFRYFEVLFYIFYYYRGLKKTVWHEIFAGFYFCRIGDFLCSAGT